MYELFDMHLHLYFLSAWHSPHTGGHARRDTQIAVSVSTARKPVATQR